jgi:hypothetical protein
VFQNLRFAFLSDITSRLTFLNLLAFVVVVLFEPKLNTVFGGIISGFIHLYSFKGLFFKLDSFLLADIGFTVDK